MTIAILETGLERDERRVGEVVRTVCDAAGEKDRSTAAFNADARSTDALAAPPLVDMNGASAELQHGVTGFAFIYTRGPDPAWARSSPRTSRAWRHCSRIRRSPSSKSPATRPAPTA